MKIKVHYIYGLNGDRVIIYGKENEKTVWTQEYSFGYNVSSNRRFAKYAEEDYLNSIKYGWKTPRCLKPYIGDILTEILSEYKLTKNDIEYSAYFVLPQRDATKEEVEKMVENLYTEVE